MGCCTSCEPERTPACLESHYDRLWRYVRSLVRDNAEADDLTQEVFLRAYQQIGSLRDPGAVLAWLYQIATHICLDRFRQRARRASQSAGTELEQLEIADPHAASPQQAVQQNEMSQCVQRYVAGLPDSYRAVLLLHDQHGLTGPEIARTLGVSVETAKIRLHRARRKLQAALESGCTFSHDERNVLVCEPRG